MRRIGLFLVALMALTVVAGCGQSGEGKVDEKLTEGTTNVNEAPNTAPAEGTPANP